MNVAKSRAVFDSKAIVGASALIFTSGLILSLGGFAFHALASRRLGVEGYGVFYAVISLYSLATIPVNVFAPVVTKYSAEFSALHDDGHVRGLIDLIVRTFAVFGLFYVVAGAALAIPLADFFHFSIWEAPVVAVMASLAVLSSTMRAIGQGVHAYAPFAWSTAGEGIAKIAALLVAVVAGLTIFGTIAAFSFGVAAGAVLIALPLAARYRRVEAIPVVLDYRRIIATTAGAAVLTFTITMMGFADVLIVKHFFPPEQAGLYSVTSLCGKILLYLVGFVPAILIPQATHRHARGERTRKLLLAAVGFIAIVSIVGVAGFRFDGALVLHALAGRGFDAALPLLPGYAAAMAALAMTNSLGAYGISTHRLGFAFPLFVVVVATLWTIAAVHPTLAAVVRELMIGNIVMIAVVATSLAVQARKAAPA